MVQTPIFEPNLSSLTPVIAYVALGSNVGNPGEHILRAFRELEALPGTRVVARSSLYRTAPVGYLDQPDFINAVVKVETVLSPRQLLDSLLALERAHGRVREHRDGPRTLDLDILIYDDLVTTEPELTIPHPRMHQRAFVLLPLHEIAPDCEIPGLGPVERFLPDVGSQGIERIPEG